MEANATDKQRYHPHVAHKVLPDNEMSELRLLKHYGLAVHMHAHVPAMLESIKGEGFSYPVAPHAKLNWKRGPVDSTFLWKLTQARRAESFHEIRDATVQEELDEIAAISGKTARLEQALNFANTHDRTWHRRWSSTTESRAARHLRLSNRHQKVEDY